MAADPTRPNPWLTLAKLVGSLLVVGVLAAGVALPFVGGLGIVAGKAAGKFIDTSCKFQESQPPQKTTVYARDRHTVIATLFSQDRVPIPLTQIPKYLQDALIATEDRRFYQHHGVDLRGLIRSAISTSNGDTQGGSTLDMQYVKQVRYYQAGDDKKKQAAAIDINLQRKMEDAKCALYLENTLHYSKQRILDDYLNIAFFGEHSYGIQTAAENYFHKPASKLTLDESALLVGMLRAPSAYDPFVNRAAAKERRDEVLQNLVDVGKLSQAAADQAKAQPVALATQGPPAVHEGCANAGTKVQNAAFFCEFVVNWLETTDHISPAELQTGGLKVYTTLDPTIQNSAQQHLRQAVPPTSPMTAVLPVIDPRTGDILAMAASKKYGLGKGETEQPVFTKYTAFGASTFKLFPLLTALSTGIPSDWSIYTGTTGDYKTTNCATESTSTNGDANETYSDNETLATAAAKSSNTYFVALADHLLDCQLRPVVDLMAKLGMNSLQEHDPNDNPKLTYAQTVTDYERAQELVLGSIPTSPLEIAGAYAAVANGGKFNMPAPVLEVVDSHHQQLPVKRTPGVQVIAPQVAARAVNILTEDTQGVGTSAGSFSSWYSANPSEIAGKTGTNESNTKDRNSSIWFVGMTPDLVAASGIIDFDNTSVPSSGLPGEGKGEAYGDYAAKVWLHALEPTLIHKTWTWPDPESVPGVDVPSIVGMDPTDARAYLQDNGNFKMVQLDAADQLACPSTEPLGTIAYYGPQRAAPGSTITVCTSSQIPQPQPPPPPPVIHHHKHPGNGSGSGSSSPPAGGGSGSTGGGGGGHTGGHGGGGNGPGHGGHPRPGPSGGPGG